jgi:hypothetical protein
VKLSEPRIILYDIETAPSRGWFYDRYRENNIIEIDEPGYILSYAWKELGKRAIHCRAVCDYPSFRKGPPYNDRELVGDLWAVLDAADLLVAHNGDDFDQKVSNASFLMAGLQPPGFYHSVDTLKIARGNFRFPGGNRLDDLGHALGVGRKIPIIAQKLQLRCAKGDVTAFPLLKRYNCQDVALLHRVYDKLKPYAKPRQHFNLSYYTRNFECPRCQGGHIIAKGREPLMSGWKQRYKCKDCGHRFVAGPVHKS